MPGIPRLGRAGVRAVGKTIDDLFDRLKARLLGPHFVDKKIMVTFDPYLSLPGLFAAAAKEEGYVPDTEILDSLLQIAGSYIEAARDRAKAQVVNNVNNWIASTATGKATPEEINKVLGGSLTEVWRDMSFAVRRIIDTEATNVRNVSIMDGIVKVNESQGINDPNVYFVVVHDEVLCDECKRLHLLDDMITPRVWKLSEVGQGYHHKGESDPKIGGLHPHCRCILVTLLPGFGFEGGKVSWIKEGHDEYARQHRMERHEPSFGEPLEKADVPKRSAIEALSSHGWIQINRSGHYGYKPPEDFPKSAIEEWVSIGEKANTRDHQKPVVLERNYIKGHKLHDHTWMNHNVFQNAGLAFIGANGPHRGRILPIPGHPFFDYYKKKNLLPSDYDEVKGLIPVPPALEQYLATKAQTPPGPRTWQVPEHDGKIAPLEELRPSMQLEEGPDFTQGYVDDLAFKLDNGRDREVPAVTVLRSQDGTFYHILEGHSVWEAAKRVGKTYVPIIDIT